MAFIPEDLENHLCPDCGSDDLWAQGRIAAEFDVHGNVRTNGAQLVSHVVVECKNCGSRNEAHMLRMVKRAATEAEVA